MQPVYRNLNSYDDIHQNVYKTKHITDLENRVQSCRRKILFYFAAFACLALCAYGTYTRIGFDSQLQTLFKSILIAVSTLFCWDKYTFEIQNFIKAKEELKQSE